MADLTGHAAQMQAYAERLSRWASPEVTGRAMVAVGESARLIIWSRTVLDGLDCDGVQFPPYSTRRVEIMPSSQYYSMLSGSGRTYRLRGAEKGRALAGVDGPKRRRGAGGGKKLKGVVFDAGWAQIKQVMGGSGAGHRNMTMRGDMMGEAVNPGFVVTNSTGESVTLDFVNSLSRVKAEGQHERFNWWGVARINSEREKLIGVLSDTWIAEYPQAGGS
jgi:hypothetical protein